MDLNKLTTGEKVIAASGIIFLIATFLPWYGAEGTNDFAYNGWDYFLTGILPLIIVVVMVAQIAIARFTTTELPKPPIPWSQVHLFAGIAVAVLALLRVLIAADVDILGESFELERKYGLWIAVLAAIGVGVGGFLKSREPEEIYSGPVPGGPGAPPPPGGSTF